MNDFFSQFWLGIRTYKDAAKFIADHRLWHFFLFPLLLSAAILWGTWELDQSLKSSDFSEVSTIRELMSNLVTNLLIASIVMMGYKLRKYIVFIVLSPLLTQLSVKTEQLITGNRYKSSWQQYGDDLKRAVRIALGNFIIEYSIFAAWYIFVLFIPDARPLSPFFLYAVGCYFYGFSMIDYVNERRRLNIDQSVKFVREHAGFAVGNGAVFSLMFFIPYDIGVIFAPVLAIVAATIGMHEMVDLNKNPHAIKE